ncbi:translation elongation factor Ts [Alkalitalea saponilacus]|uniref:Elongation factor Ts n=1 Tax=Alkalitalea saponilacus TaxID=889453 RepID=A0A1T5HSU7_9BACT|nr:translation elongation factor Ts [Alkalitalea saponilacus]ASB49282.1 translation elongation factor Ts [Alkalitalea saponilacus]SKC23768.1 elongation factor Ts [Alkalitalea saponilacus]
MAITAADVSKLRKMTGAGMMDCKKALAEADGDFDKAVDLIRKKGQAVANKRADRDATEGVVLAKVTADNKKGAIVVLNCETDFVAKNESFIALADSILDLAIASDAKTLEEVKELQLNGIAVKDVITEQIGVIGEKLDLPYFDVVNADTVVAYIHPGNKLATLVGLNQAGIDTQIGKDVAMQVAAMNPVSVDRDSVPQEIVEKELEIAKEQTRQEGKPENMVDKIAQGRLAKFFKESTLLDQVFVKDGKISIREYLQQTNKDLTVTEFKRYSLNN